MSSITLDYIFDSCFKEVKLLDSTDIKFDFKEFLKVLDKISIKSSELNKLINDLSYNGMCRVCDKIINGIIKLSDETIEYLILILILGYYFHSTDTFIKVFDFIHIENYFKRIYSHLSIMSLSEYLIKYRFNDTKVKLIKYLISKGDTVILKMKNFKNSPLYILLMKDHFNLAKLLVNNGAYLYEDYPYFVNTPLFYSMFFRHKETLEISDEQWELIKVILTKLPIIHFKKTNYVDDSDTDSILYEFTGSKIFNPLSYAMSGYSPEKVQFIIDSHPEFFEDIIDFN